MSRLCRWFGKSPRPVRRPARPPLAVEALERRQLLDSQFGALASQLDGRLLAVEQGLHAVAAASNAVLPVVGKSIGSFAGDADTAVSNVRTALQNAVGAVNGSAGIPALQNTLANGLGTFLKQTDSDNPGSANDVHVETYDPANGDVTIRLSLGQSVTHTFDFNLGLPVVPLLIPATASHNNVTATVGFRYDDLTFGLQNGNFFVDTSRRNDEIRLKLGAALNTGTLQGTIGFVRVTAAPTGDGVGVGATLVLDATDKGGVTFDRMEGSAFVNLHLDGGFTSPDGGSHLSLPQITSDFHMNWPFAGSNLPADSGSFGSAPTVKFTNVQLNLGTFLSDIVRPMVRGLKDALTPLEPILALLNLPVPLVSDLAQATIHQDITALTLANAASSLKLLPPDWQTVLTVVNTVSTIDKLTQSFDASGGGSVFLNAGDFDLSGNGDLRGKDLLHRLDDLSAKDLTSLTPYVIAGGEKLRGAIDRLMPDNPKDDEVVKKAKETVRNFADDLLQNKLDQLKNGVRLEFPFATDPQGSVFRLLLGQDVDFARVTVDLNASASATQILPLWGPVNARLGGDVKVNFHFGMGCDTYGLREFISKGLHASSLVDGFYFDAGQDLLRLSASVSAGGDVEAPIPLYWVGPVPIVPSASVNGTLSAQNVRVWFPDTGAGKCRPSTNLGGPLFNTQGRLTTGWDFRVEAGPPDLPLVTIYKKVLDETTLLDLDNGPYANPDNPFQSPLFADPVAEVPAPVTIDLNNLPYTYTDGRTNVTTVSTAGGRLHVDVNGYSVPDADKPLDLVPSLSVRGSVGRDQMTVIGSNDLNMPIALDGGDGFNSLTFWDRDASFVSPASYTVGSNLLTRDGTQITDVSPWTRTDHLAISYKQFGQLNVDANGSDHQEDVMTYILGQYLANFTSTLGTAPLTGSMAALRDAAVAGTIPGVTPADILSTSAVAAGVETRSLADSPEQVFPLSPPPEWLGIHRQVAPGLPNLIHVTSLLPGPVSIWLGHGGDQVTVDAAKVLGGDGRLLSVHGGTGNTILTVQDDPATSASGVLSLDSTLTYTLDDGVLRRTESVQMKTLGSAVWEPSTAISTLRYDGIDTLVVNGRGRGTVFNVERTTAGMTAVLNGVAGPNSFNLSPTRHRLDDLRGPLTVNGGGASDTLTLFDQANADVAADPNTGQGALTTRPTYTLSERRVTRTNNCSIDGTTAGTAVLTIDYQGVQHVALNAGDTDTVFNVVGVSLLTPVVGGPADITINAGAGNNAFAVGSPATGYGLSGIWATVILNAGAGSNTLVASDAQASYDPSGINWYYLGQDGLGKHGQGWISTSGTFAAETLITAGEEDHVSVAGTPAGTPVTIRGTGDGSTIFLGEGDLSGFQGPLTITGGFGTLAAEVNDISIGGVGHTYTLDGSTLSRDGIAPINFGSATDRVLFASVASSVINVLSTPAGTETRLYGGTGINQVTVGDAAGTLDGIQGALYYRALGLGDTVTLNDVGNTADQQYMLSAVQLNGVWRGAAAEQLQRGGMAPIAVLGATQEVLNVGQGTNGVTVASLFPVVALSVVGTCSDPTGGATPAALPWTASGAPLAATELDLVYATIGYDRPVMNSLGLLSGGGDEERLNKVLNDLNQGIASSVSLPKPPTKKVPPGAGGGPTGGSKDLFPGDF